MLIYDIDLGIFLYKWLFTYRGLIFLKFKNYKKIIIINYILIILILLNKIKYLLIYI